MDVVYADVLFARNALLDYLLLLSAARLLGRPLRRVRFGLAAVLGGVYAAAAAVPPLRWLAGAPAALAVSLLLAWIAFGPPPDLWRCWGVFLAVSALFAGAVYALGRLAGQSGWVVFAAPPRVLLLSFGGCYAAVRLVHARWRGRRDAPVVPAEILLDGRRAVLSALRDTGNRLEDPLTGAGVLVADPAALAPLFSPPLPPLPEDPAERFVLLSRQEVLRRRLRLVSFTAVGTERGLLVCFRPDAVRLEGRECDLLVAFSPTPLTGDHNAVASVGF